MCMFCLHLYLCTRHTQCPRDQKRVLDPQPLHLQMVVSCHHGAGNLNLSFIEKQLVLVTVELSLQAPVFLFEQHKNSLQLFV